jgi:microcystin-dependent protein
MGTTAHGIWYPEDYNAASDVPLNVKDNALSVEAALVAMDGKVDAASGNLTYASPIGSIIAFAGAAAPAGWHLCDGTAHGSASLRAVLVAGGSAAPDNTPDLRSRFVVGAGPGPGLTAYTAGTKGGAEQVTLAAGQSGMPAHTHTATTGIENQDHTHLIDPPSTNTGNDSPDHAHAANPGSVGTSSNSHNHSLSVREGTGEGDGYYLDTNPTDSGTQKTLSGTLTSTYAHTHTVDLPSFNTAGASARHVHNVNIAQFSSSGVQGLGHTHAVTVAAAAAVDAGTPHENRPPFFALTYMIRKS